MKRKPAAPWLASLNIKPRLLVWLATCQSRHETAAIRQLGYLWSARSIRLTFRELQREQSIELECFDRVTWRITAQGRSEAARVRESAKSRAAA